jgi:hypothetical protein
MSDYGRSDMRSKAFWGHSEPPIKPLPEAIHQLELGQKWVVYWPLKGRLSTQQPVHSSSVAILLRWDPPQQYQKVLVRENVPYYEKNSI